MKRLVPVGFALVLAIASHAQEAPRFGENIDVNLVLLDAIVTDSRGNQILGLGKDDFIVREEGVVQKIESVEYFTNRTLLTSKEENAPFKVERSLENRFFVFFFDKPSDSRYWAEVTTARNAAKKFVQQLRAGDQVAVAGHDVRLKIYSDFTSDRDQLLQAIDRAADFGLGIRSGDGPILSNIDQQSLIYKTGTVYEALEVLGKAMRSARGRKNLFLFTAGIHEPGQAVANGFPTESLKYRPMVQALNAANVSVYAMNIVRNLPDAPVIHWTLEKIADDTRGEYYRYAVNFDPLLARVEHATNGYYLLSYYSTRPKGSHGFQRVSVRVKSPELQVKAREGYMYGEWITSR